MGRKHKPRGAKKAKTFKRDLRREILDLMATQPQTPMNHKQIASALGIKDAGMRMLIYELLLEAVSKKQMKQISRGKFKLEKIKEDYIEGKIEITQSGRGFVILEGYDEDIPVRRRDTGGAFWGDMVQIAISNHKGKLSGRVLKVVERAKNQYVGVLELSKNYAFVKPTDNRMHTDFFIPLKKLNGAENGDKVVVKMTDWKNLDDSPFGEIVSVLGRPGDNETEMHSIMAEYGLPYEFPTEVEVDAERIPSKITKEEIAQRLDMRDVVTFTIDPDNAKDFDDALSLRKLENGNWEVGVHIADVAHYLKPGSLLDKEAIKRATSVYLVDRVVPMLPEVLSNGLCSLRPHEEKLCFSAVFELNDKAQIQKEWFGRTVILSDRRFTYEEAQEIIEGAEGDFKSEILELDRLSKLLRAERFKDGSLDFSS
ncbi:MAG: ribonuclease R family protein, partial [Flavobacteriales bacterium]